MVLRAALLRSGVKILSELLKRYKEELIPQLQKELGYINPMQVPWLEKITLNMGVGEATRDRKEMDGALVALQQIAGQKPVVCNARKSVASFKVRTGFPIGCKVTLRRGRMYDFVERLTTIALPRQRDFRGLRPQAFDGTGNFSMGVHEHIIFAEIDYDKIDRIRGLDISVTTTARDDASGLALLRALGFPFRS